MKYLGLILMLVVLAGCGPKIVEEHHFTINQGRGTELDAGTSTSDDPSELTVVNIIYLDVTADVVTDRKTDQEGTNDADLSLAQKGAAAAIASVMKDINPNSDDSVNLRDSQNNNRVDNSTEETNSSTPVIVPDKEKIKPVVDGEYNSSQVYDLKIDHGKMHTWLDESGATYSETENKSIKFVWPGCTDFIIPDAYLTTTRNGTTNQAQAYYQSGMNQKDYRTPEGHPDHNDAAIHADPSCKATTVTLFYNVAEEQTKTTEYSSKETIEPWNYKGKSFGRFEHPGTFYGKNARLSTVRDCGEMIVKDASVSQGYYGTQNFNQNYFFSGSDYPDKDHEYFTSGRAAIMTRIGCIADTATIEYNEVM